MKNVVLILTVIALSICSCNNGTEHQAQTTVEKEQQDSILKARIEAQEAENKKLAFEDSIAVFAWDDAKFGMTKKEVLQTKAFSGSSDYGDSFSMDSDKRIAFQRCLGLNRMLSIWIDFGGKTENEVIKVRMDASAGWKDFTSLVIDMQKLIEKFASKYGMPDEQFEHLTSLSYKDLDQHKSILIAHWIIGSGTGLNGTKHIRIYASTYTETSYQYKIDIYNSDFPKQTE